MRARAAAERAGPRLLPKPRVSLRNCAIGARARRSFSSCVMDEGNLEGGEKERGRGVSICGMRPRRVGERKRNFYLHSGGSGGIAEGVCGGGGGEPPGKGVATRGVPRRRRAGPFHDIFRGVCFLDIS